MPAYRPIDVMCPRCKAYGGDRCRTLPPANPEPTSFHVDRRWLATQPADVVLGVVAKLRKRMDRLKAAK